MLVKERMTPQPLVVVTPDTPITEAQQLMQDKNIRHMPVVTEHSSTEAERRHNLVGLLTRETMLQAMPWSAASLSTLETQYILSKIKVGGVMIRDVTTITEDIPVEAAARIMVDHKMGCLPVLRDGFLVGIITDIDLLATTMEMLGALQSGLRLSVLMPHRVGEIARLSTAIAAANGNLTAFGTWEGEATSTSDVSNQIGIVLRVEGISEKELMVAVEKLAEVKILDVREM